MRYISLWLVLSLIYTGCASTPPPQEQEKPKEQKESKQTTPVKKESSKSLYERLGGEEGVEKAVRIFYSKVLGDKRVQTYFGNTDIERQIAKQRMFVHMAFGGDLGFSKEEISAIHRPLVETGLDDSHVDAVLEILGDTLRELGASEKDITEVRTNAEKYRTAVLNR